MSLWDGVDFMRATAYVDGLEGNKSLTQTRIDGIKTRLARPGLRDGYEKFRIKMPDGKYKIKSIYTEDYFVYNEKPSKTVICKLMLFVFWAIYLVSHIMVLFTDSEINRHFLVQVIDILALLLTVYLTFTLVVQLASPVKRKIFQYTVGSARLKEAALIMSAVLLADLALMVYYSVARGCTSRENIMTLVFQTIAFACVLAMFVTEVTRRNVRVDNDTVIPDGAEKIG